MLTKMLWEATRTNPDKAAIVQGKQRISYSQLYCKSGRASEGLRHLGVCENDCVAVVLPNCPEFVISVFACARLGAVMLPLNPRYTHDELERFLLDGKAKVIITDADHLGVCRQIVEETRRNIKLVVTGNNAPNAQNTNGHIADIRHFSELLDNTEPGVPAEIRTGRSLYLYTSGSTSEYKRLCCTQENLYFEAHNFVETIGLGTDDTILCTVPLYHSYGLGNGLLDAIYTGATLVLLDALTENGKTIDPPFISRIHEVLDLIRLEQVRFLPAVPYQFAVFAELSEEIHVDLSSIRWCVSSGDVLPEKTYDRFLRRFGLPIRSLYGSTEAGSIAMNTASGKGMTYGSLGGPLNNVTLEIRDTSGNKLNTNESGVIWVKSPVIPPSGYDNRPELSETVFRDGYYDTGDMGLLDEQGQLVITGRKQTFVDVGGYKVDISEVEEVLLNHEHIREVAVLGIESAGLGEIIKAVIVLHDNTPGSAEEIQAWCREKLASYKVPGLIEFRDALPRSPLGKVLKKELHNTEQPDDNSAPLAEALAALGNISPDKQLALIAEELRQQIAATLQINADDVLPAASFQSMGFDSIRSAELQNRLIKITGLPLSITLLWNYPSINELSRLLLKKLSAELSESSAQPAQTAAKPVALTEPLAIIGIGCRFPGGVSTPEQFWEFLVQGGNGITEIPPERWDVEQFFDPDPSAPGKSYSRWGGFLDNVSDFDAGFFNVSPREALQMDPRQRLLLETAWEALEHAACAPASLSGSRTGVFVGHMVGDYHGLMGDNMTLMDSYVSTGVLDSLLANRLSYALNLQGPSLSVDTACSSALSALYLAGQNLRQGECDVALVGGVNLMLTPEMHVVGAKAGILSPKGSCSTFSDDADGFVRGEGCGIIVLKRLSDAERDNDNIIAVVHGTAMNQDGHTNGIAAPNGFSQQRVIQQALQNAQLNATQVSLIEAHGTGTLVGDPIEVEALSETYGNKGNNTEDTAPCYLGAVKTNIGHLEGAAGIAGLIKMSLCLEHRHIPPNTNFRKLNPHINLDETRLTLPLEQRAWEVAADQPRYGAVSSFGIGGTNGHVILGQAPAPKVTTESANQPEDLRSQYIIPLSAPDAAGLQALAQSHADYLLVHPETSLADMAYTLQTGRNHFAEYRQAIVTGSIDDLIGQLQQLAESEPKPTTLNAQNSKAAFVFTGQGSQYPGMGHELYLSEPVFRQAIDRCAKLLQDELDVPLSDILYPAESDSESALINQTAFTQPALFAVEYALATLWQSWGIRPDWVMGHSVGEYVAACIAGVFSLADGLKLIAARGRLMQALPANGAMLAVRAKESLVAELIAPHADQLAIAAINGPESVVLSGSKTAIAGVTEQLQAIGVETQRLNVSHAFHSPLMEPMLEAFAEVAAQISYAPPQLKVISNVSGRAAGQEITGPAYWVNHVRATVRFADGMATLDKLGCLVTLEAGPHPTLSMMGRQCITHRNMVWANSLRKNQSDAQTILTQLGHLYQQGLTPDWQGFNQPYPAAKLHLPTYPFQRRRYWLFDKKTAHRKNAADPLRPLVNTMTRSPRLKETLFETRFDLETFPFFHDHQVHEQVVVPGAAYLAMLFSSADVMDKQICYLADLLFPAAMVLNTGGSRQVQVVMTPKPGDDTGQGVMGFELLSWPHTEDLTNQPAADTHMIGELGWQKSLQQDNIPVLTELQSVWTQELDPEQLYRVSLEQHIAFGPAFRWMKQLWKNDTGTETLAKLVPPPAVNTRGYSLHPALLDACFQVAAATLLGKHETETWLPFLIRQAHLLQAADSDEYWCHACQTSHHVWDITLFNKSGEVLLFIQGFEERPVPASALAGKAVWEDWLYQVQWQPDETEPEVLTEPDRSWLIFADNGGLGNQLADKLSDQGCRVKRVFAGTAYAKIDPDTYCVNTESAGDYRRILSEQPDDYGIIYLWGLDWILADDSNLNAAHQICTAFLQLIQALSSASADNLSGLWLATCHAQQVASEASPHGLLQSQLWGLQRTLTLEHPELACRIIDLDTGHKVQQVEQLLQECARQPLNINKRELQIAYRDGQRYLARLVAQQDIQQPRPQTNTGSVIAIDPDANYLITGGLGGLGLEVCDWLISKGAQHLILLGRSAPSTRAAQQIARHQNAGISVSVILTDITIGRQHLKTLINSSKTETPIKGIIHAAGVADDATLLQQTPDHFVKVMAPKIKGAANLHELSLDLPLDFFILFSSMASMLGSVGQANYGAANAFMDHLAHYRRRSGLPALSINWGGWSDIGMASRMDENELRRLEKRGETLISPEQGREILSVLLNQHAAQVGVLPIDWVTYLPATHGDKDAFFTQITNHKPGIAQDKKAVKSPARKWRQILDDTPAGQRAGALEGYLRQTLADALGLTDSKLIEARRGLRELGLDSILSIEVRARLEDDLGCSLPATLLFDYPTLEELSGFLATRILRIQPADNQESLTQMSDISLIDDADLTSLFADLDQISDAEIQQQLIRTS